MLHDKLQSQFLAEATLLITVSSGALEGVDSVSVASEGDVRGRQGREVFRRTLMILHVRLEIYQFLRGAQ